MPVVEIKKRFEQDILKSVITLKNLFAKMKTQLENMCKENKELSEEFIKVTEELDKKDVVILQRIAADLSGKGFFEVASLLGNQESREMLKVSHLSALVDQNWMIIRQLGRLNANIEKLLDKK